jgi:16S rRNA (cytosine1402-N4)-methyltransferase
VGHEPVLRERVGEYLLPSLDQGGTVVDATLGRGGHALALLEAAPAARLIGIDRDPEALDAARTNLAAYSDRIVLVRDDFKNLATVLERLGVETVRGVLLDLGVSSPQLDEAHRGFSFRHDGPLDMRMDPSQRFSASDVVNGYTESDLERVIRTLGEERFARRVARAIIAARPIEGTERLADIVKEAIPAATRRTGGHPARRTFQALRLEVNGELPALESVLPQAVEALEAGGRLAVLSYHSLEDRRVKHAFRADARGCVCPPDFPICVCGAKARLRLVTRKSVTPSAEEIERNPRAKSARLRVAERLAS